MVGPGGLGRAPHVPRSLTHADDLVTIVNPWDLDSYPPITMTYDEFEASFIRYDTVDLG